MSQSLPSRPLSYPLPEIPARSVINSKEYKDRKVYLHTVGDTPKPEDPNAFEQWEMANAHLTIFDLVERVYLFAPFAVEHNDLPNFLAYCEIAFYMFHHHHHVEEKYLFPAWEKSSGLDIWERNVEQHHAFLHPMNATWLYVHTCRKNLKPEPSPITIPSPTSEMGEIDMSEFPNINLSEPFDPKVLQDHMDTWLGTMSVHMTDEIETLKAENISKVDPGVQKEAKETMLNSFRSLDPTFFLPGAMSFITPDKLKVMFPIPWFVMWLMVPFWFAPKYWGSWRYAPYPQNLTFTGRP